MRSHGRFHPREDHLVRSANLTLSVNISTDTSFCGEAGCHMNRTVSRVTQLQIWGGGRRLPSQKDLDLDPSLFEFWQGTEAAHRVGMIGHLMLMARWGRRVQGPVLETGNAAQGGGGRSSFQDFDWGSQSLFSRPGALATIPTAA